MTRQLDIEVEQRETSRRDTLIKALEYGIVGALQGQGIELSGLAFRYGEFSCFLTVKAVVDERGIVAFVASDTLMNCILRCQQEASHGTLKWSKDKWYKSDA